MTFEIILVLIAILFSAFFSSGETAFTVAGKLLMDVYNRHGRRGAKVASKFYENPDLLFSTTLVGTNLANVFYSSVFALLLSSVGVPVEIILIVSPLILLLFGEILPKSLARERPESVALGSSILLWIMYLLLLPMIVIVRFCSSMILKLFGVNTQSNQIEKITIADLRIINEELRKSGVVDDNEAEMVENVLGLKEKKVREIMTPRTKMTAVGDNTSIQELEQLAKSTGYSRIPVYTDDIDHIKGIIHIKDLLSKPVNLDSITREARYIPEQMDTSKLLGMFRHEKMGLVIVVDEHGGTAGMVSIEDLVEELVGEIEDEYDRKAKIGKVIAKGAYLVEAEVEIQQLKRLWNINLPEGGYETVAGLIFQRTGKIPKVGETIQTRGWILRIVDADDHRIRKVLIRKISKSKK